MMSKLPLDVASPTLSKSWARAPATLAASTPRNGNGSGLMVPEHLEGTTVSISGAEASATRRPARSG
jgi:hypothetical protein